MGAGLGQHVRQQKQSRTDLSHSYSSLMRYVTQNGHRPEGAWPASGVGRVTWAEKYIKKNFKFFFFFPLESCAYVCQDRKMGLHYSKKFILTELIFLHRSGLPLMCAPASAPVPPPLPPLAPGPKFGWEIAVWLRGGVGGGAGFWRGKCWCARH